MFFVIDHVLRSSDFHRALCDIDNVELILVSNAPLEGNGRNELIHLNMTLRYPIRHFTVKELQFDPTEHASGPKSITVLTEPEIQQFIAMQRGLPLNGRPFLTPDYEDRLESITGEYQRALFIKEAEEEILSKIPTINTNDPYVKWRGYQPGDILRIVRRIGNTRITYRRVILIAPAEKKELKLKKTITTQ